MLILGHRGASIAFAENTPPAFAGAAAMGADGVELDVRLAPSGHKGLRLVVHHDPVPPEPEAVDALPSLDAVLDACGDRMLVNVEIKNDESEAGFDPTMGVVAPVVAGLRARGHDWVNRVLISSFSARTLEHCRLVGPEFATAQLASALHLADRRPLVATAAAAGHSAVHPDHRVVTREFVMDAHAAGLAVNVWTVNDPDRIVELAEMGVDGVCTDVPDVALAALGRSAADAVVSPRWVRPARSDPGSGTPA